MMMKFPFQMLDNGPQYSSDVFQAFSREYGFQHVTSSPNYPQANGVAERTVKNVKQMLKKNADPYIALLTLHSMPLENGHTPSELLMGRKLRTTLPMAQSQLIPSISNMEEVREREGRLKVRMKQNFDNCHRAVPLQPLHQGHTVWIPGHQRMGTVIEETNPR